MSEKLFGNLGTGERVLNLLKSTKEYGGPQSVDDVCINLEMKKKNATSILSRLCKKGKVDRIRIGIYRAKGDDREYVPNKSHHK